VPVPDWIWCVFIFAFGCCIGSFLNVVVYRLPRDKSLVLPPSSCPACDKHIRFYDNIPLFSWLLLGRKCRHCKAPISARYFVVELLTGSLFLLLFILYHRTAVRSGMGSLADGRWLIYVLHITLLAAFIAASAIDLEFWVIPLCVCWLVTAAGLAGSSLGAYLIPTDLIRQHDLLPWATSGRAALAVGAAVGLGISWLFVVTGLTKRSYETGEQAEAGSAEQQNAESNAAPPDDSAEPEFNHRIEASREILFLLPIIVCALIAYWIAAGTLSAQARADFPASHPVVSGLLGSLFGYFAGCAVVWLVRILGTFGFGKEAMGLGDVHLMGAAGAVIGPLPVVIAFFIAPFFGLLGWAVVQLFFKKIRQIPYGPSLSLGILTVMIFHDWILNHFGLIFYR